MVIIALIVLLAPMLAVQEPHSAFNAMLENIVQCQLQCLRINAQRVIRERTLHFQGDPPAQAAPLVILMEIHKPLFVANVALIPTLPMLPPSAHSAALEVP
jgi:hypothetical protein